MIIGFYGLVLYWVACFHLAFVTAMEVTPSLRLIEQAWFVGGLAVALQSGFVVYFHKGISLEFVEFPPAIKSLMGLVNGVRNRRHLWVFYPLFLAVALYLYGNFDRSILTLLWVFEAFAIFALSLIFRESHFRYLAMASLVGCLLRLVIYDLSRSSTLTRAVVFLGVGLLMLAMNSLYNRYKERF